MIFLDDKTFFFGKIDDKTYLFFIDRNFFKESLPKWKFSQLQSLCFCFRERLKKNWFMEDKIHNLQLISLMSAKIFDFHVLYKWVNSLISMKLVTKRKKHIKSLSPFPCRCSSSFVQKVNIYTIIIYDFLVI